MTGDSSDRDTAAMDARAARDQSPHLAQRSLYFISLLLLPAVAVLVSTFIYGGPSTASLTDSDKLTAILTEEIRSAFKQELRQLEQRIRLLEEDSLFKGKTSAPLYLTRPSSLESYPPVYILPEGERKRILVTGGAGFVGSHLVDRLMRDGHEVIVVDNFFTGRKKNIEHWIGHDNFELVNHDIVNPLMIEVDEIYHLASPASPVKYMYNPIKTIKTNTMGTLNMLGLAKRVKGKILLSSTSEVYGDPEVHPQVEEYWGHVNPIGPRACYDEGKRVAETMAYAYAKQENVEVRVARIFNTYGPKMHMYDGRVVSNFIIQALQNKTLTVFAPGNQSRSFMYISDLIDGLIMLMNSNFSDPVNLGNPDEYSIFNFAESIISSVEGTSSTVELLPATQDDPRRRRPSIERAKAVLGWEPKVSLKTGIQKTVDYFRTELQQQFTSS